MKKFKGEVVMKFILGTLLALISVASVASTGNCKIEGFAQKNHGRVEIYRFLNQEEVTTLEKCEAKLQKAAKAVEQCLMVPAGEVSHIQMTFTGEQVVKNAISVSAYCPAHY